MHGHVVQFRLNPEDVMSCIDVITSSGINTDNMSLAMVCRLVLSSYLQGSRDRGMIPKREGYEYTAMVSRFTKVSNAKKAAVTNNIIAGEIHNHMSDSGNTMVRGITEPNRPTQMKRAEDEFKTHDADMVRKRAAVELAVEELSQREIIEGENFTAEQHAKLVALQSAFIKLKNNVDVDVRTLLGD